MYEMNLKNKEVSARLSYE